MGVATSTYIVGVVHVHDPASTFVDFLVALVLAAHGECGVHVHVVAGEIERDEALKDDAPAREGACEEN